MGLIEARELLVIARQIITTELTPNARHLAIQDLGRLNDWLIATA